MTALERLARDAGIAVTWTDASGKRRKVSARSLRAVLAALGYPAANAAQARRSRARLKRQQRACPLRVVTQGEMFAAKGPRLRLIAEDGARHILPVRRGRARADLPPGYYALAGKRRLAVTPPRAFLPEGRHWGVSLQLYSLRGSPGIGDFAALDRFCWDGAHAGADAVLVSPVFAMRPGIASPYAPASRLLLNPLYIAAHGAGRGGALIDWEAAERQRAAALRRAFHRFCAKGGDADFTRFVRAASPRLKRQAGAGIFPLYLQWRAERALADVQRRAKEAGMAIGLVLDLPVGLDPQGAEAAAHPGDMLQGLSIGAPPDAFNPNGQDWGLTGFSPAALVGGGYAPFLETLRAAMRHAGGIRLDHAMSLMRLWVIPHGMKPRDGAYLHYPFAALLGLLCLESQRHRALVIAEDLGTVPAAFRRRIVKAGLLGMEVLWFARDAKGRFVPPARWPKQRAALTTTHDLPTLAGWWRGRDLDWRARISGKPDPKARTMRARERRLLWAALRQGRSAPPADAGRFADAAIAALARAPSPLLLVAVEDMIGEIEQPNIPGTITEHPNWRRRLKALRPFAVPAARRRAALLRGAVR